MVIADRNQNTVNNIGKKKMSLKGMCMHHRTQKAYPHWSYATDSACPTCEKWDDLWYLTEVAAAAKEQDHITQNLRRDWEMKTRKIQEPKINIKQLLTLSHFSWMMGSYPRNEDNTGHELEKQEFLSEECGEASTWNEDSNGVSYLFSIKNFTGLIMSVFMCK